MFHAHCCLTWPNRELLRQRSLDEFQHGVNHKLLALSKAWLYTQLAVLVIQTPLRMQVQRWLFRVSTAQDTAEAVHRLQAIFASWPWSLNRNLAWIRLLLGLCGPLLLWDSGVVFNGLEDQSMDDLDKMFIQILSICSSNLLMFMLRLLLVCSLLYFVHVAQPAETSDASCRGLSQGNIQRLRKIVFNRDEAESEGENFLQCAVCLAEYQTNDRLMVMPCDPRHNFHEACIEPWLRRMNTCPLCQRPVVLPEA